MPWTLYRYMLKDLLRLLVLSTAVLVCVVSFAVALKPLNDGVLSATALPRYVMYMTPMILVIVLPFAAAFAGTLVFNRLANDNEILACRAMGMSYQVILLPVAVLGMALMLGLYLTSNYVVPRFYATAERMLQNDLTHMLVRQIDKRQPLMLGDDMVLYADAADDSHPPPVFENSNVQPKRLIMLRGVALGRLNDDGRLRSDSTARSADVLVWEVGEETWVTVSLKDVSYFDPVTGEMFHASESEGPPPLQVPSPFKEKAMFLSLAQLKSLTDQPEGYKDVRERKHRLVKSLAAQMLIDELDRALAARARHGVELLGPAGDRYLLYAPFISREPADPLDPKSPNRQRDQPYDQLRIQEGADRTPVRIDREVDGAVVRRTEARQGIIEVEEGQPDSEPRLAITLTDVRAFDTRIVGRGTAHAEVSLPRLRWPEPIVPRIDAGVSATAGSLPKRDVFELLDLADESQAPSVKVAASVLRKSVANLARKIVSQFHIRAATSVVCLLVLVFGAVLSMQLKGGMPLVVFFWAFMLAFVAMIMIRSGDNICTDADINLGVGIFSIWAGNLMLAVAVGATYFKLTRT